MEDIIMGDEVVPPDGIFRVVYDALQRINVEGKGQHLDISLFDDDDEEEEEEEFDENVLDDANAQFIVSFLRRHPIAVKKLSISIFAEYTPQAVEILRTFLSETTNVQEFSSNGHLGPENARRLLTGLHGNTSVTTLELSNAGFGGRAGARIISELLLNNSYLKYLYCAAVPLGLEGARALRPSLISNEVKLQQLSLFGCRLCDEGIATIVNALLDGNNNSLVVLGLPRNEITSNSLPHLARLLELYSSLNLIDLSSNPSLFHQASAENTGRFLRALSRTRMTSFIMNRCQIPGPVISSLLHSLANRESVWRETHLYIYDEVQIQGKDLKELLKIIPTIPNLTTLQLNLDCADESVLASFNQSARIRHLYTGPCTTSEITTGRMFDILDRNCRSLQARKLLRRDRRDMTVPLGLWSKGIEKLTRESTGATAAYNILRNKIVMWWLPSSTSSSTGTASTTSTTAPATASAPAAATTSTDNAKRSLPQDSMGDDDDDDDDRKPAAHSKRMRQSND